MPGVGGPLVLCKETSKTRKRTQRLSVLGGRLKRQPWHVGVRRYKIVWRAELRSRIQEKGIGKKGTKVAGPVLGRENGA